MKKINYVSLCSGIGAECEAFKRLRADFPNDFDFDCLAWSEIDKHACISHDAAHPEFAGRNIGDMITVDWGKWMEEQGNPQIDLLFYSTPCQSVSKAGKQRGMKKGDDEAASALIWHTERAIKELKPKVCILENVKGMVSKKNRADFDEWCGVLENYGYVNHWKILNAKDYGVAQNRERVFMVSILRTEDDPNPTYNFPKGFPLTKCVEDYMEPAEDIGEEYYISQDRVTGKVLSDIIDQPNVREEMEKLYHEEIKAAIADGANVIEDKSEPWWTFISAELVIIQNAFNPKLKLHILYRDRMKIEKDVDCDWYERGDKALDKTIDEATNGYRLTNIGECEDSIRELYRKWRFGE